MADEQQQQQQQQQAQPPAAQQYASPAQAEGAQAAPGTEQPAAVAATQANGEQPQQQQYQQPQDGQQQYSQAPLSSDASAAPGVEAPPKSAAELATALASAETADIRGEDGRTLKVYPRKLFIGGLSTGTTDYALNQHCKQFEGFVEAYIQVSTGEAAESTEATHAVRFSSRTDTLTRACLCLPECRRTSSPSRRATLASSCFRVPRLLLPCWRIRAW